MRNRVHSDSRAKGLGWEGSAWAVGAAWLAARVVMGARVRAMSTAIPVCMTMTPMRNPREVARRVLRGVARFFRATGYRSDGGESRRRSTGGNWEGVLCGDTEGGRHDDGG